ncbi:YwdI family protein [Sutcliffiella rhizosphaerae]|uniref:YwdI family protein n=1 Tax=Sutcliffiella rhizosphaerae TaxID=2880967 RepID=A0ABN8A9L9_9BACI|nr:YwdI family protein [Sutcliffiella rhizosphaerae]CAG9620062.1 hypothetical protein BACCIP111883_00830 [Sutcliffiella rhizosphaerae]
MSITLDKVLARLEAELEKAMDTGNVQKKREHLAAMKSLCELALETDVEAPVHRNVKKEYSPSVQAHSLAPPSQISNNGANRYIEEDANGDSLFDF